VAGRRTHRAGRPPYHSGLKHTSTPVDLIDLIRRLAQHSNDREIALVLSKQGRHTPTGLPFSAARVAGIRERAGIRAAPPPTPGAEGVSINEAARQLGVCTQTIRRWLAEGLLPAEQTSPHAPWRISITDQVRQRFVPDVPAGYLKLDQAARQLGLARQTVLNQVRSGQRRAVHIVRGNAADCASRSTPTNKDSSATSRMVRKPRGPRPFQRHNSSRSPTRPDVRNSPKSEAGRADSPGLIGLLFRETRRAR
jgi:excisionase family DNA binding protein